MNKTAGRWIIVFITVALLALIVLNFDVSVARADDVSGVVAGFVYGRDYQPLESINVYAYPAEFVYTSIPGFRKLGMRPVAQRVTNHNGFFVFLGLLPGHYVFLASREGYQPECSPQIAVIPNGLYNVVIHVWRTRGTMRWSCLREEMVDPGISF